MTEISREEAASRFITSKGKTYKSTNVRFRGSVAEDLANLSQNIQAKAIVSAAAAGARVLYDEMLLRVPVDTGKLKGSIYRYLDRDSSRDGSVKYAIGPNKREAPHWFNVEYGHFRVNPVVVLPNGEVIPKNSKLTTPEWVPASPYMRPTIDGKGAVAVQAARDRLNERLRELIGS